MLNACWSYKTACQSFKTIYWSIKTTCRSLKNNFNQTLSIFLYAILDILLYKIKFWLRDFANL